MIDTTTNQPLRVHSHERTTSVSQLAVKGPETARPFNASTLQRFNAFGCRFAALCWLFILLAPYSLWSCSIPVFRYALEHWPTSPYELILINPSNLDNHTQTLVERFTGKEASSNSVVNLRFRVLTPPTNSVTPLPSEALPKLVLRYPEEAAIRSEIWSGPLTETNLNQLLDSPARRRIVQRLIQGDCAVWVFLESGDPVQDDAAARVLQTRLEHCQQTLALPSPDPESGDDQTSATGKPDLKATFSLLRLARNDHAEEVLVRMLLGSEEDLNETREPMAFPIYGRGRVLYALVGKGINPETIDEACLFLAGPCSCVVKEQNPGLDLLLSANWDHLIRPTLTSAAQIYEAIGLTSQATLSRPSATNKVSLKTVPIPTKTQVVHPAPPMGLHENLLLKRLLLLIGGLGTMVLVIGALLVWYKKH